MRKKRVLFSTHLMTSVVILVTGSVILISVVLFIYLGQRLDAEFRKKILAQKGQAETILGTRIEDIRQQVATLATDNSLRVTIMMDDTAQLEEMADSLHSEISGVSYYIKKRGFDYLYPEKRHTILPQILKRAPIEPFTSKFVEEEGKKRLLWWLEAPIMHNEGRMGAAFALYDMMQDIGLAHTFEQAVTNDIFVSQPDKLIGLFSETVVPLSAPLSKAYSKHSEFIQFDSDLVLISLEGFPNIYFSSSRKGLIVEKRNIALFIGLFALAVLTVSVFFSIILGKRLAGPLSEMANRAYHISRGAKGITFNNTNGDYIEFQRLAQVFNDMLVKLKDMEEKTRYTELMENVDDAVYLVDDRGNIIQSNEATRVQLGYSVETPLNIPHDAILPKKDVSTLRNLLNADPAQTQRQATIETDHIGRDGTPISVEIKARAITYRGQNVILNVARDIRSRKEAEQALRESEQRYRSVVESSHDGIMIIDEQRLIVYVNTQLCRILGYSRDEIEGNPFSEFLPETISLFRSNPEPKINHKNQESFGFTRKDGEDRHGSIRFTTITDPHGNQKAVVQLLDITDQLRAESEKKQLEAQLLHAQKMEAIGTLAGGVAHDFNNLLQVIHGYTELLLSLKSENDPDLKQLREIKNASQRASDLTDQLLTFSRKTESTTLPMDLTGEVEQGYRLLTRTIPNSIKTTLYLADDLKMINADPGRIQQVILNLGVNARDAMPEGGKLVIETKNVFLDELSSKKYLEAKPGDYVRLSVTDTGFGMDEDTIKHIFEPFFTTKSTGKGTGLGMSIVYGIVQDAGGYITCYSEIGVGTTFRIYFPAAKQATSMASSIDYPPGIIPSQASTTDQNDEKNEEKSMGSETILLVDDEERIRTLGVTLLAQYGYSVITAANGIEALALYQAKQDDIDLVILDLIMPEMDGRKCFKKLKEINPEIRVIMSSGYAVSAKEIKDEGINAFIDKPYEIQLMLDTIRTTLDEGEKKSA